MSEPTQFQEIFRLFLNSVSNDYRLNDMFKNSPEVAEDMLLTWLEKAIGDFYDCQHDLSACANFNQKTFTVFLTPQEKNILSRLMIYNWMEYNIDNIVQMNLSVQDRDYKTHAAERNLLGKLEYQNNLREKIYHDISEYTKKFYPISSWGTGG